MHLFTLIQVICLAVLWIVKTSLSSLAIPFFVLLLIPVRFLLNKVFSQKELEALEGQYQSKVDVVEKTILERQLQSKVDVNEKTILEGQYESKVDVYENNIFEGDFEPIVDVIEKTAL
jgi:hypothetical protein